MADFPSKLKSLLFLFLIILQRGLERVSGKIKINIYLQILEVNETIPASKL